MVMAEFTVLKIEETHGRKLVPPLILWVGQTRVPDLADRPGMICLLPVIQIMKTPFMLGE